VVCPGSGRGHSGSGTHQAEQMPPARLLARRSHRSRRGRRARFSLLYRAPALDAKRAERCGTSGRGARASGEPAPPVGTRRHAHRRVRRVCPGLARVGGDLRAHDRGGVIAAAERLELAHGGLEVRHGESSRCVCATVSGCATHAHTVDTVLRVRAPPDRGAADRTRCGRWHRDLRYAAASGHAILMGGRPLVRRRSARRPRSPPPARRSKRPAEPCG
jgi:hypothetical protein